MQGKRLRVGMASGALVAGSLTVTWKDPDTALGTSPQQVALEAVPQTVIVERSALGGTPGSLAYSATATGVTITSSSGTDTSSLVITAFVRVTDFVR